MMQETAQSAAAAEVPSPSEAVDLLVDKLGAWIEAAIQTLPNLILAIVILCVFWVLSGWVRRGLSNLLERGISNQQIVRLIARILSLLFLAAGLFFALGILGLNKTVTTFLAGAGVVGLALGFAFQDTAENFISGVLLALRQPFNTGDLIEANGIFGTVESTNLRSTIIRRLDGPRVYVPNSQVFKNPLTNFRARGGRRVDVSTGVSYADDLEKAEKAAMNAVNGIDGRDSDRDPECFWTEFGGSSINCVVRFWLEDEGQRAFLAAQSDAIKRIKTAFDEQDISIPFPIRTLDFGIEGGVALKEMLSKGDGD